jgi:hypothetical protein
MDPVITNRRNCCLKAVRGRWQVRGLGKVIPAAARHHHEGTAFRRVDGGRER